MTGRCVSFSVFIGVYYIIQLAGCIGTVNFYGDTDRFNLCGDGDGPLAAAKVFDRAILMLAVYHLIEWIKTTFLLAVVCIGLNLMWIYYFFAWNTLYGVVT